MSLDYRPMLSSHQLFRETVPLKYLSKDTGIVLIKLKSPFIFEEVNLIFLG
jgi:hypothetical protein